MNAIINSTLAALPAAASLKSGALHLQKNQILRVPGAAGWTVKTLRGSVWITQEGDLRDIVLEAGQSYDFNGDGPGVLSSLAETDLCVAKAA
jgi:hypothetical protein